MKQTNKVEALNAAEPFLRWAGGKRQIIPFLLRSLPADIEKRVYIEPFVGAASLFFAVQPKKAILADANGILIDAYRQLKDRPEAVRKYLAALIRSHSDEHYYAVRDEYNASGMSARQAARFIYLNKSCFNGIFRVNTRGQFNVPKGSKDKLRSPTKGEYQAISTALDAATLHHGSFQKTLALAEKGDFVYLDPPYPALNSTAYFAHYTADRFDNAAQTELAEHAHALHNRGVLFLMSNADVRSVRTLYEKFQISRIPVMRFVSANGIRKRVSELLITNY